MKQFNLSSSNVTIRRQENTLIRPTNAEKWHISLGTILVVSFHSREDQIQRNPVLFNQR